VRVAADGAAALDLLRRQPCDLVVTDVEMPGLDGFPLTARIRADDAVPGMPAAAVAAGAVDEVVPLDQLAARIAAAWTLAC
jgi:two-component system chemotaxis sensor kinase CheA